MGCAGSKTPEGFLVPQSVHPEHVLIEGALGANNYIELHARVAKGTGLTTLLEGHGQPQKPPLVTIYEKPDGGGILVQAAEDIGR